MGGIGAPDKLLVKGKRLDGRKLDEVRQTSIEVGVIPNADGSCKLSMGDTEVIVAVYGPRELFPKHLQEGDRAHLNCLYDMATFSTPERGRSGPSRRSKEISRVMADALAPAIMLEKYPKAGIDIYALVSNANAGTRCAAINAASVALADAGIQMRDMVTAVATGKIDEKLAVDLFVTEDNFGDSDMAMAVMPRTNQVTLLQMDGDMSTEEVKEAMHMNFKACKDIYEKQIESLKKRYAGAEDEQ